MKNIKYRKFLIFFLLSNSLLLLQCKFTNDKKKNISKNNVAIIDSVNLEKKDSTLKKYFYLKYLDSKIEKMNFISFTDFEFDSVLVLKKKIKAQTLNKSRKANYLLSNKKFKEYIKNKYPQIFIELDQKITSNESFIVDEEEYSMPIIENSENYSTQKDSVNVDCDLYIIRIYYNGEKFNIIPIVTQIRKTK